MADGVAEILLSEDRDIFATFTPASGTLTLTACLVTLRDASDAIAGGINGVTATGITSGASAAPQAWYRLDPDATNPALTPGTYFLSLTATDSSGFDYTAVIEVEVLPVGRGTAGFTYDVTTPRGKVRLLCTDVNDTAYVFSDAEIDAFISLAPSSVYAAAALACETWARSRAKLSQMVRAADGTSNQRYSMQELLALAKSLREAVLSGGLVTDTINTSTPGELLDSYRPEWRGINDLPVVE